MRIIAIWHTKGGVGKSTIAVNLGLALHKMGKKVLLVDSDTQETTLHLSRRFKEPKAISYCQFDKRKARKYDYVIVDTVGIDVRSSAFEGEVLPVLQNVHGVIMPWVVSDITKDEKLSEKLRSVLVDYKIRLFGVILNQTTEHKAYRKQVNQFQNHLDSLAFNTKIRQASVVRDRSVITNIKHDVVYDYEKLADEFVERVR